MHFLLEQGIVGVMVVGDAEFLEIGGPSFQQGVVLVSDTVEVNGGGGVSGVAIKIMDFPEKLA